MKKTAIICEINPYHNGHRSLFERARADGGEIIIAVMSGNFTQRGIPAVFDKYLRASLLVSPPDRSTVSAADLVVELPFPWCSAGAEAFALGGISVALGMGADSVACGSENGDTGFIYAAAEAKNSPEYLRRIRDYEKESRRGEGSAVLNDAVMRELGFSLGANDKLAAEYVRCLGNPGREDVALRVYPRISAQSDVPYRSASELRERIYAGRMTDIAPFVPAAAYEVYSAHQAEAVVPARFYELAFLFSRLFWDSSDTYAESAGGLAERLRSLAGEACCAEEFMEKIRTKKYTDARLRRALLYAMLKVQGEMLKTPPAYTVLLAANGRGREYLSMLRKTGDFPVITKPADAGEPVMNQYRYLTAADSLYTMCGAEIRPQDVYLKKHPYICPQRITKA